MKRWKRLTAFLLTLCLALGLSLSAWAANETVEHAYALNDLGLFQGTDSGFELDKRPTRVEGMTMFVRLLGGEEEALSRNYAHPFTDVPKWGDPYVGYAWEHGLTKGTGKTTFGSTAYVTLEEYTTFVLRSLGYDDGQGDFTWKTSVDKAVEIGLMSREEAARFLSEATSRGTMVDVSFAALTQTFKGSERTLAEKLVDEGVFTRELAIQKGVWTAEAPAVSASPRPTESVRPTNSPRPTESTRPTLPPGPTDTPDPAPSPKPVENPGGKYAVITDKNVDGVLGSNLNGWYVTIMAADGSESTYAIHKDSTKDGYAGFDKENGNEEIHESDLIEYSISGGQLKIKTIASAETVAGERTIWDESARKLVYGNNANDIAVAASDAVVFVGVTNDKEEGVDKYYTYNLCSMSDVSGTNIPVVAIVKDGMVKAVYYENTKRPNGNMDTTYYGIVTGFNGRRQINGDTFWCYTVAVGEDEDIEVRVFGELEKGQLVCFNESSDGMYTLGEDIFVIVTADDTVCTPKEGHFELAAIREYNESNRLLTYYTGTARNDADGLFEGDTSYAITVSKDFQIVYVDGDNNRRGEDVGVCAYDCGTGYANAILHINEDGIADTIIVETSGRANLARPTTDDKATASFGATEL